MVNKIKITSINQIFDGQKLLTKEFINLDLSNLDLSIIPITEWENCIFYNTSFKNTRLKFIPNKLAKITTENAEMMDLKPYKVSGIYMNCCDFSDNDLTFLKPDDFYQCGTNEVGTYGCDFTNTGINFLKTLINLKLDISYEQYSFESDYWKFEYGTVNWPDFIDVKTIIKNPNLTVPSFRIMNAISDFMHKSNLKNCFPTSFKKDEKGRLIWGVHENDINYKKKMVKKCEKLLQYDKQGYGKKLYFKLKPFMQLDAQFDFFMFSIKYLDIKDVNFEDIPAELLRYYSIQNNTFTNIIFNNSLADLLKLRGGSEYFLDTIKGYENKYKNVSFPNITYSSWQENPYAKKRISESSFTFFNKVYLELSRTCNAKCRFCRNTTFTDSEYNLQNIINTLKTIESYVNAVVIGGGEPTLKLDDVKKIHQSLNESKIDWHMFTNGTLPKIVEDEYILENFKINLSRHAINDKENACIFKVNENKIMTYKDIEKLNQVNEVTLNATCFNGGLDTLEKIIDYITFAKNIGCKKVLLQNLQQSISLGINSFNYNNLCIDPTLFDKIILELKSKGYKESFPIYATGGYITYRFTDKDKFSIAIQKYISKEQLENEWSTAIKRAFDLSIDPNGNLYENWNQTDEPIKKLLHK